MKKITEQELSEDIIKDLNSSIDELANKEIGSSKLKTKEKNNIVKAINEINKTDDFMKNMNEFLNSCGIQIEDANDIEKVISEIGKVIIGSKSVKKTMTYDFIETSEQNRSYTLKIPNLIAVKSVTVDNGKVSKMIKGNEVTIKVSDGDICSSKSGTKTLSKEVRDSRTSSSNSFDSTISYNDGGYTGTLHKNGGSYVTSGSYTPSDSRVETDSRTSSVNSFPESISYSSGGYSGTLYKDGPTKIDCYVSSGMTKTVTDKVTSSVLGNLPQSISYNSGGYSGTLYKIGEPTNNPTIIQGDSKKVSVEVYINPISCKYNKDFVDGKYKYNKDGYVGSLNWVRYTKPNEDDDALEYINHSKILEDYVQNMNMDDISEEEYNKCPKCHMEFTGTVTKPSHTINNYTQNYSGTVSTPKVDNQKYTQNYKGTVTKSGSDTRIWKQDYSGTVYKTESVTNTITKEINTSKTSSNNNFDSTISYNEDGFTGTLQKDGMSYVSSGSYSSGDSRTETDSKTSPNNSFPERILYSSGGYSGTLYKDGSVIDNSSYVKGESKTVSIKKRELFKWTKSKSSDIMYDIDHQFPSTMQYNENGYTGTLNLKNTEVEDEIGAIADTRPESTSAYGTATYEGVVTKPGYKVSSYTQKYKGKVYKSGYDTRQYTQKYKGKVSKQTSQPVNNYKYKVTIKYTAIE